MRGINQAYANTYRNIGQQGQNSFYDMANQLNSGMGQSGFSGGGMFQKALMSGNRALQQAQNQGLGDARFNRQSGIEDVQQSFYDKALSTAMRLFEGGATVNPPTISPGESAYEESTENQSLNSWALQNGAPKGARVGQTWQAPDGRTFVFTNWGDGAGWIPADQW
jgi:hypothetical protein